MTLLRVLLMSIAFVGYVQSFPSTIRGYETGSTAEQETKKTTDPIPVHIEDPQEMVDSQTNSEGESSIVEFVFKGSKEGLSVPGSSQEKYTIVKLPTKNEDEKLNLSDSSKDNEIDIDRKDELYKLNITGITKSEDLLSEAQIKRDQWLFDPQEMSSITGGMPKYFYDAIEPIYPFPELSETVKPINPFSELSELTKPIRFPELSETAKPKEILPVLEEKSYERSPYESLGGVPLFPKSAILKDIDDPFYMT